MVIPSAMPPLPPPANIWESPPISTALTWREILKQGKGRVSLCVQWCWGWTSGHLNKESTERLKGFLRKTVFYVLGSRRLGRGLQRCLDHQGHREPLPPSHMLPTLHVIRAPVVLAQPLHHGQAVECWSLRGSCFPHTL